MNVSIQMQCMKDNICGLSVQVQYMKKHHMQCNLDRTNKEMKAIIHLISFIALTLHRG